MPTRRVRTTITLDPGLAEEAREFGLNVSAVAQAALRQELRLAKAKRWHKETAEALRAHQEWLHGNGYPLQALRPDSPREAWEPWQRGPLDWEAVQGLSRPALRLGPRPAARPDRRVLAGRWHRSRAARRSCPGSSLSCRWTGCRMCCAWAGS